MDKLCIDEMMKRAFDSRLAFSTASKSMSRRCEANCITLKRRNDSLLWGREGTGSSLNKIWLVWAKCNLIRVLEFSRTFETTFPYCSYFSRYIEIGMMLIFSSKWRISFDLFFLVEDVVDDVEEFSILWYFYLKYIYWQQDHLFI